MTYNYIARDQYDNVVWIKDHPRKELLEHCGRKHADKMYRDGPNHTIYHVGYVINTRWFTVYRLGPLEKGAQ